MRERKVNSQGIRKVHSRCTCIWCIRQAGTSDRGGRSVWQSSTGMERRRFASYLANTNTKLSTKNLRGFRKMLFVQTGHIKSMSVYINIHYYKTRQKYWPVYIWGRINLLTERLWLCFWPAHFADRYRTSGSHALTFTFSAAHLAHRFRICAFEYWSEYWEGGAGERGRSSVGWYTMYFGAVEDRRLINFMETFGLWLMDGRF